MRIIILLTIIILIAGCNQQSNIVNLTENTDIGIGSNLTIDDNETLSNLTIVNNETESDGEDNESVSDSSVEDNETETDVEDDEVDSDDFETDLNSTTDDESEIEDETDYDEEFLDLDTEAVFKKTDCSVPPARNFDWPYYDGPMIDTHLHIASIPDGEVDEDYEEPLLGFNIGMDDYACMMKYENTSKAFAFFPVWEPIIPQQLEVVNITMDKYPGQFVPFIMPPDSDDSPDGFPTVTADKLEEMLEKYPGLFKGYGEIGLYERGDHGGPKGAPELPPDSQRLQEIYPIIRKHNLMIYFHLGEGQKKSFEKVLDENPDLTFIWHGDQLIPYEDGGQDLSDVEEILSEHPNVYYGVDELYGDVWLLNPDASKEDFLAHFKDYKPLLKKDLDTWKGFIGRHPDQVIWGSDRGVSTVWSVDEEVAFTLNNYTRTFIGRLDPSVQEKFAYKNAEKLIAKSGITANTPTD